MSNIRQKRKSCEACRARKLRCSGKETGCSRCVHLGLACRFHEKGMPGRPRKWSLVEPFEPLQATPSHHDHLPVLSTPLSGGASSVDLPGQSMFFGEASNTTDSTDIITAEPQRWTSQDSYMAFDGGEINGSLSFLDFDTRGQLDSLSLNSLRACLSHDHTDVSPTAQPISPPPTPQSCDCARQVFDTIRSLNCGTLSHSILTTLRQGTSLFEQLLTCPICYDVFKPPRVTLQNVLLVGRLTLEISSRYRTYLNWLKDHCADPGPDRASETVYLSSSMALAGISISREKLYDLVKDGLKDDAERLVELGRQFETRQKNRHLIGHGACPDEEGRCWREKDYVDPDPSDICPQNSAAWALIPCYRVVDEVRAKIKVFEDALA